ncbi:MAG TPA: MFS transporter [Streptosporangiaceae bacterium]|jgi:DHA3 family tetracycline resistance protein-like MFS transporter|nr:MFS transporter [Streptosporangiaceae bacterium]
MPLRGRQISPYRLYLVLECGMSFLLGISYATITVYWVTSGRLNPLQLLLLGTVLELSYFLLQLPTGVLADLVSRRLCILAGLFIVGLALLIEGRSPAFGNLLGAQVVLGLGAALNNGAQEAWIADELAATTGDKQMTGTYLRATQLGLLATIAGSLLSGVIALAGLNKPLLVGGALICLLAAAVAVVMPENNFRRPEAEAGVGKVVRQAGAMLSDQVRSTRHAIVAVPGLVLLFGMTFFAGMWSESFDRLWGAFLLRDISFPRLAGLHPAMWFSLFACAAAVLGLGATELAKRRTERLGPDSVVGALLVLTVAIGAAVVGMATAHAFAVVVAAYLVVSVLRPVLDPLLSGWMVGRIQPSVRATALSAKDMFDSGGQILGGPVVGAIGTLASLRIALLAGAAALGPAAACIAAASRRIRPVRGLEEDQAKDDGVPIGNPV